MKQIEAKERELQTSLSDKILKYHDTLEVTFVEVEKCGKCGKSIVGVRTVGIYPKSSDCSDGKTAINTTFQAKCGCGFSKRTDKIIYEA